jgi:hypothetical protein
VMNAKMFTEEADVTRSAHLCWKPLHHDVNHPR